MLTTYYGVPCIVLGLPGWAREYGFVVCGSVCVRPITFIYMESVYLYVRVCARINGPNATGLKLKSRFF